MSHVIGIDIGTSGIKVGAMDGEGGLSFLEYQNYEISYSQFGLVEINANEIWKKVEALILSVWEKVEMAGIVDAISLSCFCNSAVFMSETGEAIYPGILYLDQRSQLEADEMKRTIGEDCLFHVTRNRLEPGMYNITTYLWFKKHKPKEYKRTYKWGNLSTFILQKLTGEFVIDWTQASFSGIYNVQKYEWSKKICERIGVDQEKLPEVVDPCVVIGHYYKDSVANVPVVAGAADTACSTLSLGIRPGKMFESVGTSNVLTVCTEDVNTLDSRFLNRCHVFKNQWLSHGAMSFPGASIQWFYEQFLQSEGYDKGVLKTLASKSKIGANGLYFLPYMQGERSPIWDPDARGAFVGLHLTSTKADMFRAVLEGCAFGLRQIYNIIESNYNVQTKDFPSIGGGSKNRDWAQIKANVLNESIEIKDISETGVLGACLIASQAAGYFSSIEQALSVVPNNTVEIIYPQMEEVKQYDQLFETFCDLYPSLQSFFAMNSRRN